MTTKNTVAPKNARKAPTQAARAKAKAKASIARQKQRAEAKLVPLHTMAATIKTPLHIVRTDAINAGKRMQGVTRTYAAALLRDFGDRFWIVAAQKGKLSPNEAALRNSVRSEQRACKALAESRGLSNVYKPWSDAIALLKNPEGRAKVAKKDRPAFERIKEAVLVAFKVAHTNYEDNEKNAAYSAFYDDLEALCTKYRIDVSSITEKQ